MSEEKKALIAASREAAATGESPLEYMLRVMRDAGTEQRRRDQMAMGAAPFVHPKLAAVEHSGNADKPVETRQRVEHVIVDAAAGASPDDPDARATEVRATH